MSALRAKLPDSRALLCRLAVICAVLLVSPAVSSAAGTGLDNDSSVLERRVKAAFLYKFADYVAWPDVSFPHADSPITISVAGDEPLAAELVQVIGERTLANRPVTVKRFRETEPLAGIHVLFIAHAEMPRLNQTIKAAQAWPILIVTQSDGALDHGSMINLVQANGRMRFEVAVDTAERQNLKLSSRLLSVARNVRTGAP